MDHDCSVSRTSSTGHITQDNFSDPAQYPGSDIAKQAQRRTAQLAALLSTEAGQALVQRHLCQAADLTAKAQRQTEQLAMMLSNEAGKAALQKQLSVYLQRKQQVQGPANPPQSFATATPAPASTSSCTARSDASNTVEPYCSAEVSGDSGSCGASDLPPRVLAAAVAVSRLQPGSTAHTASLAALKQELAQHAPLSTTLALAGGSSNAAAQVTSTSVNTAAVPEQPLQHNVLASLLANQTAARAAAAGGAGATAGPADTPATLAQIWSMLQQKRQQTQDAPVHDLARLGTQVSTMLPDSSNPSAYNSSNGARHPSQMVFKRRTHSSTALRRHISNANKPAAAVSKAADSPKAAESNAMGPNKPHQVFKKQRKRPLTLWSSSSASAQQLQLPKQQETSSSYPAAVETEYNTATGSSGADGCSLDIAAAAALFDVKRQLAASPAAITATADAPTAAEKVLDRLALQEQQLLFLQQQLRQQRELIMARRQAQQQQQQQQMPAPAAADVLRQLLQAVRSSPMLSAGSDVDMTDAWYTPATAAAAPAAPAQQQEAAPAAPDAVSALCNLAKLFAAQQQQQMANAGPTVVASQGPQWDADVLRRLAAALLAV